MPDPHEIPLPTHTEVPDLHLQPADISQSQAVLAFRIARLLDQQERLATEISGLQDRLTYRETLRQAAVLCEMTVELPTITTKEVEWPPDEVDGETQDPSTPLLQISADVLAKVEPAVMKLTPPEKAICVTKPSAVWAEIGLYLKLAADYDSFAGKAGELQAAKWTEKANHARSMAKTIEVNGCFYTLPTPSD